MTEKNLAFGERGIKINLAITKDRNLILKQIGQSLSLRSNYW